MSAILIRRVEFEDFPAWLALWDANNLGVKNEAVTTQTWTRLLDPEFPIHALVVQDKEGNLIGLVQYVIHYTTGSIEPICYMQDLYVDPQNRKCGIARKLVERLADISKEHKWGRMYWLAEADNVAAQALYKHLGTQLNFTLHVLLTS